MVKKIVSFYYDFCLSNVPLSLLFIKRNSTKICSKFLRFKTGICIPFYMESSFEQFFNFNAYMHQLFLNVVVSESYEKYMTRLTVKSF